MANSGAPINELVNLLANHAPGRLESLRKQLPSEMGPLLTVGGQLGEADPLVESRALVAVEGLKTAIDTASYRIPIAKKRLVRVNLLRFIAEAVALIGSSAVLATMAAGWSFGSLVSGMVALSGSLVSLAADFLGRTVYGGKSLAELYSDLTKALFEARQLLGELALHLKIGIDPSREESVKQLTDCANDLARRLNEMDSLF